MGKEKSKLSKAKREKLKSLEKKKRAALSKSFEASKKKPTFGNRFTVAEGRREAISAAEDKRQIRDTSPDAKEKSELRRLERRKREMLAFSAAGTKQKGHGGVLGEMKKQQEILGRKEALAIAAKKRKIREKAKKKRDSK